MSSKVAALTSLGRGWDAGGTYGTIPPTSPQADSLFQKPLNMSVPTASKSIKFLLYVRTFPVVFAPSQIITCAKT